MNTITESHLTYLPDDALIVRNIHMGKSFIVFYGENIFRVYSVVSCVFISAQTRSFKLRSEKVLHSSGFSNVSPLSRRTEILQKGGLRSIGLHQSRHNKERKRTKAFYTHRREAC